MVTYT